MDKLKYRVIYGYNPVDYIAIDEDDLEKASYAWRTDSIYTKGGKSVKGGAILRIEKDYRAYTKWYDTYSPTDGEDMAQIARECPADVLFIKRLELANQRVAHVMINKLPVQLLSDPSKIDTLRLN